MLVQRLKQRTRLSSVGKGSITSISRKKCGFHLEDLEANGLETVGETSTTSDNRDLDKGVAVAGTGIFRFTLGVCGLIAAKLAINIPNARRRACTYHPPYPFYHF